jgi:hypothetical protein
MPSVEPGSSEGRTLSENQRRNGYRQFREESGSTGIEDVADHFRYGGFSDRRSSHIDEIMTVGSGHLTVVDKHKALGCSTAKGYCFVSNTNESCLSLVLPTQLLIDRLTCLSLLETG